MKIISHLKTAIDNLFQSPMRTILAMLGIIVGTASVVALVSSGKLATEQALLQFKSLGMNLMSFSISPVDYTATPPPIKVSTLNELINIKGVKHVAPFTQSNFPASYKTNTWDAPVVAATASLATVVNIHLQQGRFINVLDKSQYFCVIGQKVLDSLKILSPVGEQIRVGNLFFTVIGVAETWPENNFFRANVNDSIIIPINTMRLLSTTSTINNVIMTLHEDAEIDEVKKQVEAYIQQNNPGFALSFQSAKELVRSMENQQQIFTLLLGFIGSISLFVGGIGVMNIMLAAVSERQYEIGLRLALGAQPIDIQWMFLLEATLLAVIGGSIGVILGLVSTFIVAQVSGWTYTIFLFPPLIGFTVSVLISLFFGFYPAYLASKLNPIEALRGI